MEVRIKGKVYEYDSDYPDGWKFARGDNFKFPVVIGPYQCFIKRFQKRTRDISGWQLLSQLAGAFEHTLVRVYALCSVVENRREVYYAFFEYTAGKDLEDSIAQRAELNLTKLTDDLFTALQILQAQGYWLPDFFEKNIFNNSRDEHYLLIDLDSAYPLSALPDIDMWGDKYYWSLVINYCKDILHYEELSPAHFNGISFNYLHSVFLLLRLKIFYSGEVTDYDDPAFAEQLPHYLDRIAPAFRELFEKVYHYREQQLKLQDIAAIRELVLKEIVPLTGEQIRTILNPPAELPVIHQFEAAGYLENTADQYRIAAGKRFELKWAVDNASTVELYRNGELHRSLGDGQTSVWLSEEVHDGTSKKVSYKLMAVNSAARVEQSLTVALVLPQPVIRNFSVKDSKEEVDNQYTIESGQPFTLQWKVEHAQKVELYRNGELYRQMEEGEDSIELKELTFDGTSKKVSYRLVAVSNAAEAEQSLTAEVVIPQPIEPVIEEFSIKEPVEKNGDQYTIKSGQPFTLQWRVENAPKIELYRNGELYRQMEEGKSSIELKELIYDGTSKKVSYRLVAFNSSAQAERTLTAIVVLPKPIIKNFSVKDYNEKSRQYTIRSGRVFTLQWEVEYAPKIELYRNEELYKQMEEGENSIELSELTHDGKEKSVEYTLIVSDDDQKEVVEKKSLKINVLKAINLKPLILAAGIIIGVIIISVVVFYYLKTKPDADTYITSGQNKYSRGDYAGAIADYNKVIRLKPGYALAYYNRGQAEWKINDKDAACNDFQSSCKLGYQAGCEEYNQYCKPISVPNPKTVNADTYITSGQNKYRKGDYDGAIADFTQAIGLEPGNDSAYYNRGLAELRINTKVSACNDLQRSCDHGRIGCEEYNQYCKLIPVPSPVNADTYITRGQNKYSAGDYNGAIADLTQAIGLEPGNGLAYYKRGLAELKLENEVSALRDLQKCCDLNYKTGCDLYNNIKNKDLNLKNKDLKEEYAANENGVSKLHSGDYKGAVADFTKAIGLNSKESVYYKNRGNAKAALNQNNAAIEDYTMAIQLSPKDGAAYNYRGLAELKLSDKAKACNDFQTSCGLKDNDGCINQKNYCGQKVINPATPKKRISDYITVSKSESSNNKGGVQNVRLSVKNINDFPVDLAIINIQYYGANGRFQKGETVYVKNIGVGNSVNVHIPDSKTSSSITYNVSLISSGQKTLYRIDD